METILFEAARAKYEEVGLPEQVGAKTLIRVLKKDVRGARRRLYVLTNGELAFPPRITDIGPFVKIGNRHVAAAREGYRYRHVDENLQRIYPSISFEMAGDYQEVAPGLFLAPVSGIYTVGSRRKGAYHINERGRLQYAERYGTVGPFVLQSGVMVSEATLLGEKFFIDINGKRI